MERRRLLASLLGYAVAAPSRPVTAQSAGSRDPCIEKHVDWVSEVYAKMLTIKPGMTRRNLLEVFKEQGGLSAREQRDYISRDCPLFQVEFTFRAVGDTERDKEGRLIGPENDQDIILTVSQPQISYQAYD